MTLGRQKGRPSRGHEEEEKKNKNVIRETRDKGKLFREIDS